VRLLHQVEEIRKAFVNDAERQAGIVVLFHLDEQLQELLVAGQQLARAGAIPGAIREAIGCRPAKPEDALDDRPLRRWITLFRDDVDKAHDVRSPLIHGIVTSTTVGSLRSISSKRGARRNRYCSHSDYLISWNPLTLEDVARQQSPPSTGSQ
jgi:hypothetical protein